MFSSQRNPEYVDVNTILESHTCLDIFVPVGMQLTAGEQSNIWLIWLLVFILNISHDLSVDDNLLQQENILGQCTGKISSSFQLTASLPLICDNNQCKKQSSEILSEYKVTYLLRNKCKLEELGNR